MLYQHYATTPRRDLAAMFPNRAIRSVECKANWLGLSRAKAPPRTDPERRKAKREFMARKRAEDPQAARDYQNAYHAANREKRTAKMRDYYGRRFFWGRAMKLRGADRAVAADLARIWKAQRGRCALTGRKLGRDDHLDHIHPKAKGGFDHATNLRWLSPEANRAKRDLSDAEFIALCADVMRWIGERIATVEKTLEAAA